MRIAFCLSLLLLPFGMRAQHLTFNEWRTKAFQDLRLLPRFGDTPKTAEQRESDADFERLMLANGASHRECSDRLIVLGFELLGSGDLTHAMFRFNQAFLMDTTNSDIYRGYGAFFMAMDNTTLAHTMFRAGLSIDPSNTRLLKEEATTYLAEYHDLKKNDPDGATKALDGATTTLQRAVDVDPEDATTAYKLAVCHLYRNECAEARRDLARSLELGGPGAEPGFQEELDRRCPRKGP